MLIYVTLQSNLDGSQQNIIVPVVNHKPVEEITDTDFRNCVMAFAALWGDDFTLLKHQVVIL